MAHVQKARRVRQHFERVKPGTFIFILRFKRARLGPMPLPLFFDFLWKIFLVHNYLLLLSYKQTPECTKHYVLLRFGFWWRSAAGRAASVDAMPERRSKDEFR